jgi:hypothetical protein
MGSPDTKHDLAEHVPLFQTLVCARRLIQWEHSRDRYVELRHGCFS